ncbi:MAG TPA: ABC transporter permease [Vicinamibacterales bacterium]|nr:ABC transporter permease [Vicinamibacterales bacterium]
MSVLQDLRYACRNLMGNPGFAAVGVLTLALGIGANTAIFSFVDGVLLRPLPYPEANRIVRVLEKPPRGERNGISTLNFLDWLRENAVFDFMAAQTGGPATLTGHGEPVQLRGARVSARYFDIFGIQAEHGRTFLPGEDERGKHHIVVLSHALWVSQFGADPTIIDRTILLDNEPHVVIGVLPAGSAFDRAFNQLWRPLAFEPSNMTRDFHWLVSFARLKAGVSLQQAQANMTAIGARIERDFPDSNKGWGVIVERYGDTLIGSDMRTGLLVLLTATGLVLLIGCTNLANLALARGVSREREVAIRASLGAGRGRLVRQLLTENLLLAFLGGALGIVLGYGTMRWLQLLVPPFSFAREVQITMDVRVLLFAFAISIATGLLFGIVPAIHATAPELTGVMKDGGRGATDRASRKHLRDVLIVTEVALAFVLLVGSGLMMRSFLRLLDVDPGIDASNVLTVGLPVTVERFPDASRLNAYLRDIRSSVDAVPGVRETAWSCAPPMQGACYGMPMQVANRPLIDRANRPGGFFKVVSPSYFSALKLRLVRGRPLTDRDSANTPPVLVINERLARREFLNQDPIGQRLLIQQIVPGKTELGSEIAWEIVGVVRDERLNGIADERSAGVYVSNEQSPVYFQTLNVRTNLDPLMLQQSITAAIHRVNKDQALTDIRTVDQIKDRSMAPNRLQSVLLGIFAGVALALAAIGIYGVTSYSVAQRTHEIGIRAALGATERRLLQLVIGRGLILTVLGLVLGVVGSAALTRLMASLLYGVGARDPVTMLVVGLVLATVAVVACYVPARQATKIDPLAALRVE